MPGDEVIQVYVKSLDNPDAPIKSLKGFNRVKVGAGKTETVKVRLSDGAFEYYEEAVDDLALRHGRYRILYGGSSRDCDLKGIDIEI